MCSKELSRIKTNNKIVTTLSSNTPMSCQKSKIKTIHIMHEEQSFPKNIVFELNLNIEKIKIQINAY